MALRLVIVDDQPQSRHLVRSLAEELGYEIAGEARDGSQGVEEVSAQRPDVVVMDWQMPVLNGLEATAMIKRSFPEIAVIAFSSTEDPAVREAFVAAGVCDYIAKEDVHALAAALERCGASTR